MQLNELARASGTTSTTRSCVFDYRRHADQDAATPVRRPVVVVGAGPVGPGARDRPRAARDRRWCCSTTTTRCRPARARSASPSARWRSSTGSAAATAWSTRACRGTSARCSSRTSRSTASTCCPRPGHERPAFINLQQYYVEGYLAERAAAAAADRPALEEQGRRRRAARRSRDARPSRRRTAPTGSTPTTSPPATARARRCASCIGQESKGRIFRDRFLIADVKMKLDAPAERWFWFDPAVPSATRACCCTASRTASGASTSSSAGTPTPRKRRSPRTSSRASRRCSRNRTMKDAEFELEWASVYTFACLRMDRFRHGRVLFAGDSAHGVSPFGARGANSGVQDAENLAWKLAAVLNGRRPTRCSTATPTSANTRPTRTSATRPARPTSSRRRARSAACSATRCWSWRRPSRSRARWSTAAGCRCRRRCTARRLNTPDAEAFAGQMVPGARPLTRP